MSRLDYSKWDKIEISDDEDDTHPNVDTPSLFRWRHEARIQRMQEHEKEKNQLEQGKQDYQQKMSKIKQCINEAEEKKSKTEIDKLKKEMEALEVQEKKFQEKEAELLKKERLQPLNIDTICKEGKSKTIINKYDAPTKKQLTDDEKFEQQQSFTQKNEKLLKKFGMLKRYDDSQAFLEEHAHLTCEETANYLVLWCINLECQEKSELMKHVAHQTIVMQFILELAKSLEIDPRGCVKTFFNRMRQAVKEYMDAFNDELESFKDRIRARAKVRLEEAMKEVEEEERQKRLGPGGLDPQEVFESLPKELQQCFEERDIGKLQEAMTKMPKEEAKLHLNRCIDSGLWVPNAADVEPNNEDKDEEVYEEIN